MSETKQQEATTEVPTSEAVVPEVATTTDAPAADTAARRPYPQRGGDRRGGAGGGRNDRRPRRQARPERVRPEFEQKIISIRRVTRVMGGGRRFSFSVAMVIGDKKGKVGVGIGKAGDTQLAIEKAVRDAKKNMIVPKQLSIGAGAQTIALLKNVPVWFEIWRTLNGFPPDYYKKPIKKEAKK